MELLLPQTCFDLFAFGTTCFPTFTFRFPVNLASSYVEDVVSFGFIYNPTLPLRKPFGRLSFSLTSTAPRVSADLLEQRTPFLTTILPFDLETEMYVPLNLKAFSGSF